MRKERRAREGRRAGEWRMPVELVRPPEEWVVCRTAGELAPVEDRPRNVRVRMIGAAKEPLSDEVPAPDCAELWLRTR